MGRAECCCPPVLREAAQTKGEVDVFGNLDYLEVMNHTRVLDELKNSTVHRRRLTRPWKIWEFSSSVGSG